MRNTLRSLFLVDMVYAFIIAALAVMLPLYLVDLQIDLVSIGLILAIFPLVFLVVRIILASIADQAGTKMITLLETIAVIITISVYAISRTARGFAFGKFSEGVSRSSFWAVARTEIIEADKKMSKAKALAFFIGIRQLADGFGRASIGFLIAAFTFQNAFLLLLGISMLLFFLTMRINKNPFRGMPEKALVMKNIFHKRPLKFWFNAMGITFQPLVANMMLVFLFPLYAYSNLGLTYEETGLLVALFSVGTAATNLLALKLGLSIRQLLLFVSLMIPAMTVLPFLPSYLVWLVLIIAMGNGCGNILSEYILSHEFTNVRDVSTEIGIAYLPLRISEFIFLSLGGFVILSWGYSLLFFICAFFLFLYMLYAGFVLRREH